MKHKYWIEITCNTVIEIDDSETATLVNLTTEIAKLLRSMPGAVRHRIVAEEHIK